MFKYVSTFWLQFKENWRVLGKENSLYPLKPVINCLCLTKFELKQTLNTEKYGKECVALESQDFLFLSPRSLKGHFCAPIWLSCHDNWSLWFKPNMINKLIKHRKKREPYQSTRKLTACLIQALSAWNSLSQACLVMLSFRDTQLL